MSRGRNTEILLFQRNRIIHLCQLRIIATKEKSLVYYPRPNRVRWSPRGRKLLASPSRKQQLGSPCFFYLPASAQQVREGHSQEDVTWHTAMRWVMKNEYLKLSKRSHHIRIWMKNISWVHKNVSVLTTMSGKEISSWTFHTLFSFLSSPTEFPTYFVGVLLVQCKGHSYSLCYPQGFG